MLLFQGRSVLVNKNKWLILMYVFITCPVVDAGQWENNVTLKSVVKVFICAWLYFLMTCFLHYYLLISTCLLYDIVVPCLHADAQHVHAFAVTSIALHWHPNCHGTEQLQCS